jgi:hypothetical protein
MPSPPRSSLPPADEEAWRKRFAEKRDIIRRLAREALEEDARGETLSLDDLLDR